MKKYTKKYRLRNSPPYSATDYTDQTMKGNDGEKYKSTADKNGTYKWIKVSSSKNKTKKATISKPISEYTYKKTTFAPVNVSAFLKYVPAGLVSSKIKPKHIYEIIDNGATPFVVFDYGGKVEVYNQHYDEESNEYIMQGKIMDAKYIKIYIGDNELNDPSYDLEKGSGRGNTILLQTSKHAYTYIGDGIRSFSTKDEDVIQNYYSPVGNNAVPYPYAIGNKYVYLMLDNTYEPVEDFDLTKDIYTQYYGWNSQNSDSESETKTEKKYKKYKVKTLFKRFY
jgi:hypothetical protein